VDALFHIQIDLYVVILVAFPEEPDEAKLDLCGGGGFPEDGWRSQGKFDMHLGCLGPVCGDCPSLFSDDQVANDQAAFARC
jgi:hypothetical protein